MVRSMNTETFQSQAVANQPMRTNQVGYQAKGGNYENPGANSTGTMGTRMNGNTTSGQPDNSELSRFMNNGGGPEPHQGSNPGAQSDPGPKEIGFYDRADNHVLGDDGVQAARGSQTSMRMGQVGGSQPNPGQRGGQNTGTSGAQTSGGGGYALDSETRNPVGFAASMTETPESTHVPDHADMFSGDNSSGRAASTGIMHDARPGAPASEEGYAYQSRAAQKLVDMRKDSPTTYSRMDEPAEDSKPRVADKAGEVADAVKDKAGGFFSGAKDKVEGFLDVDLDNDGSIGYRSDPVSATSRSGSSQQAGYERDMPGGRPYDSAGNEVAYGGSRGATPQAFETREAVKSSSGRNVGSGTTSKQGYARPSGTGSPASRAGRERSMSDVAERSVMRTDGVSRTEAQQRELVDA